MQLLGLNNSEVKPTLRRGFGVSSIVEADPL